LGRPELLENGRRIDVRRFKWIEWNVEKIEIHALSVEEVEAAFDRVFTPQAA
jgi:hypothetical protein